MRTLHAVAATLTTALLLSACGPTGSSSSSSSSSSSPASSSPAPSSTPTSAAPSSSAAAGPVLRLSEDSPKVMASGAQDMPYLAWEMPSPWHQTIKDKDGVDQWQEGTGCILQSMNNRLQSGSSGSDQALTDAALKSTVSSISSSAKISTAKPMAPVVLPRTNGRPTEMAAEHVTFTNQKGLGVDSVFAVRAMSKEGVVLSFALSCQKGSDTPARFAKVVKLGHLASAMDG